MKKKFHETTLRFLAARRPNLSFEVHLATLTEGERIIVNREYLAARLASCPEREPAVRPAHPGDPEPIGRILPQVFADLAERVSANCHVGRDREEVMS